MDTTKFTVDDLQSEDTKFTVDDLRPEVVTDAPKNVSVNRWGMLRYRKNPFMIETAEHTRIGVRRLSSHGGERLMIVNPATGAHVAPAGFWQAQEVDKTQFVKLYINGVKAFRDLSSAGTKVFELLYSELQTRIGKDQVLLAFSAIDPSIWSYSRPTFYKGMKELIEKKFIAQSLIEGNYFVNPDYIWNGNRLAFVKEYRLRDSESDSPVKPSVDEDGVITNIDELEASGR